MVKIELLRNGKTMKKGDILDLNPLKASEFVKKGYAKYAAIVKNKTKPNHFASMRGLKEIFKSNGMKYTIRNNRDRFFYPDEWKSFYDLLTEKQKVTFNTLINTGARIMEVQHIQVKDIDFDRGNIVLRVTKRVVSRPGVDKVGVGKIRVLTISTKFAKYLKGVVNKHKLTGEDYLPILSTPAANICMKKTLKEAGIGDYDMFSLHNVRKTLETWLISLDVDNFKIVKHFGHTMQVALKHYVSPDIFSYEDKSQMRDIIGDLFAK